MGTVHWNWHDRVIAYAFVRATLPDVCSATTASILSLDDEMPERKVCGMVSARNSIPAVLLPLLALGLVVGSAVVYILQRNGGHFVYTLDDPYIHMAIADNFANHGVWGVTKYEFSSSSSSLLWTLLIAGIYRFAGANDVAPFVLNMLASCGLLAVTALILSRHSGHRALRWGVLSGLVLVTPLPLLIFGGQEHILHAVLTLVCTYLAGGVIADAGTDRSTGRDIALILLAPLLTAVRYEGLFLIAVVGLLLFLRGRRRVASAAVGAGVLPIVVFGMFSIVQGWYFLPNSVLLKGNSPEITSVWGIIGLLGRTAYEQLDDSAALMMVVFAALLLLHMHVHIYKDIWRRTPVMLVIFLGSTFLHLQFAQIGWFMRYEAYLIAVGLIVCGIAAAAVLAVLDVPKRFTYSILRRHAVLAVFVSFIAVVLATRMLLSYVILFTGTDNIYEQQYQIGLFLREFYQGERVAVNDIGAVNYLADVRSYDIWGLASKEVADARRTGEYDTQWIQAFTAEHDVAVAIVYDEWLESEDIGGVPDQWVKIGEWKIPNRLTAGGEAVSFYAVSSSDANRLRANLYEFAPTLPADVTVSMESVAFRGTQ